MVRRVIEEDVATPNTTVVEEDGSWIGRTIVTLVVLALLVAGAVWLVRTLSDDTGVGDNDGGTNNEVNINPDGGEGENEQNNQDGTTDTNVPSPVPS